MNTFSSLQDSNIFGGSPSFIGGSFDESQLDTTIGLSHDMGVGQINSLFNDIQTQATESRKKRDTVDNNSSSSTSGNINPNLFATKDTTSENCDNNGGNNTIWIIVLVVILILLIVGFIVYKLYRNKKVQEQARKIYTNVTDKLSSMRDSLKRTTLESQ